MDEGFTTTAYPKVQENLKLTVKEQVILEEPTSSTGTLSSLQHLVKDLSFGDLFFNDKPSEADNEKITVKTEAKSMVSITIQQDTSEIPPMTTLIVNLTSRSDSPNHTKRRKRDVIHQKRQEGQSHGFAAPSSLKTAASAEYKAWTTTGTRLKPSVSLTPEDLQMDDDMAPDAQAHSSNDEDIGNAHIPKASALASTYSPPLEDSLLAQTECHKLLTGSMDDSIIRHNVSKPLPLGGLPGQVTTQSNFFFNKDLEHLRYGSKGSRPALSISKMKAAYYLDVGLGQMVPDQIHTFEGDRRAVRTHMWILSVVRIEVFSMFGYDYMKKIVLHRADLNEHIITERDFKYLYPSDFEDLYLLNLQGLKATRLSSTSPNLDRMPRALNTSTTTRTKVMGSGVEGDGEWFGVRR
nr:hypothetical protein [Tanacetum cinerariifolium]